MAHYNLANKIPAALHNVLANGSSWRTKAEAVSPAPSDDIQMANTPSETASEPIDLMRAARLLGVSAKKTDNLLRRKKLPKSVYYRGKFDRAALLIWAAQPENAYWLRGPRPADWELGRRLMLPIDSLGLSHRTESALLKADFIYFQDVIAKPPTYFHKMRNFGSKCEQELVALVAWHEFEFDTPIVEDLPF